MSQTGDEFLPQAIRRRYDGTEMLPGLHGQTIIDYWRWAHSDILENVQRGIFAEYLVAESLGITAAHRIGWTGYDLDYDGYKIEVKSSAYLQSWQQREHTSIVFLIGPRQQLAADQITYEADARYVADCYVFAIFSDRDGPTADVLDARRWLFFVVPIERLVEHVGTARSLSERRLRQITTLVSWDDLRERIDRTRAGEVFVVPSVQAEPMSNATPENQRARKLYLVARRKTRENPVIVWATTAEEAHLLARADSTIASFGTNVSAFVLSEAKAEEAIRAGAIDLR